MSESSSLIFSFYNDYNKINWLTYVPPDVEIFVNEEIGKAYHDQFQRFWKVLFTHNTKSDKFKI